MGTLFRLFLCLLTLCLLLYQLIIKQNSITKLQIELPKLQKQVLTTVEEERELDFNLKGYADPAYLLKMAQLPEFQYLMLPGYQRIVDLSKDEDRKIIEKVLGGSSSSGS